MKKRIFIAVGIIVISATALMFTLKKEKVINNSQKLVIAICDTGGNKANLIPTTLVRIVKDSLKLIEDGEVYRKKTLKDTSYYFFITAPVEDSTGATICTISGKDSIMSAWVPIPKKRVVYDGGEIEATLKNYKQ